MSNNPISLVEFASRKEHKKNKLVNFLSVLGFMGPYGICFAMFFLFPLIFGLIISFSSFSSKSTSSFPTGFVGFENYILIFSSEAAKPIKYFWKSIWSTIVFSAAIVPLSIVIPLGLALLINLKPPGYKFFRAAIYLPGIFPLTSTGLILIKMFAKDYGFINTLFQTSIDWFGTPETAWFMIGLFCMWCGIGGNFIILCAGLENVDKSLYEASNMDGCNSINKFFHVTLPGIKSQLFLVTFTSLTGYMNLYGQILILAEKTAENYPEQMYSAVYTIQQTILYGKKMYGSAAAMGFLLGFVIIAIALIQMVVSKEKKGGNKYGRIYEQYINSKSAN